MKQYSAISIILHWAIALAIVGNFVLGWWMHHAVDEPDSRSLAIHAYQIHKSLGLTILALSLLRLGWRLLHRPPPLPAAMPAWEQAASRITHWAFYGFMILIPLSGWIYVSTQWRDGAPLNVPTLWFGLFEVPHLFGLHDIAVESRQWMASAGEEAHELMAKAMMLLLVLHIAAAVKHHFVDRDLVLRRMLPILRDRGAIDQPETSGVRRMVLVAGFIGILAGTLAVIAALFVPSDTDPVAATSGITTAADSEWRIDPDNSSIRFSGTHAGNPFEGRFTRWQGEIQLDPLKPDESFAKVVVYTDSATDGVPLHDRSLPKSEWFDVANHSTAVAQTTKIQPDGDDRYTMAGLLTIKGRDIPVSPFTLETEGDRLTISGITQVDRAAADLGMESDPSARWVSAAIEVQVDIQATRRP